jgi:hypothetical protein
LEKETVSKLKYKQLHAELYQTWRDCVDGGDVLGVLACLAIMQKITDTLKKPAHTD